MAVVTVGIRELKASLSSYIRRVREAKETVLITEHGKPVAELRPLEDNLDERMRAMVTLGQAAWSGQPLPRNSEDMDVPEVQGDRRVADLLLEDRE
jgi:prevent-host-death family protein